MRKRELTGQRFGLLTVERRAEGTEDHYALWDCRCDCGGKIQVNTKRLVRGTVRDCGCVPGKDARNGHRAEDLSGQKFGRLTALRRTENRNGRTAWLCRCDCGNLKAARSHALKAGKVKSCGCLSRREDLSGRKFGRLSVLGPSDPGNGGKRLWRCRCDCGKETGQDYNSLVSGKVKSCGCLKEEKRKGLPGRLHHVDGTCVEWLESRKHRSDNTSGFRGVSRKGNGSWRALIGFRGKRYYLGTFRDFGEAVEARLAAEKVLHDGFVAAWREWERKAEADRAWADSHPFHYEAEYRAGLQDREACRNKSPADRTTGQGHPQE